MTKEKVYADKFFDKKMNPGLMGGGFVGIVQEERKKKPPKPLFPNVEDFLKKG
jgi:hypothetical protein